MWAGKQSTSTGSLRGILTNPFELHDLENDDDGDIAVTNAISGANDATATVTVNRTVHVVAYRRTSRRVTIPSKIDRKNERDITVTETIEYFLITFIFFVIINGININYMLSKKKKKKKRKKGVWDGIKQGKWEWKHVF
ncbi:hypothetical protein TorRG33x02_311140 [Trema orientale]|uniref:Transmembrane protein n=1 Tax=Trema orientale TaxID=63057 RepID=A0A2P5BRM1_TREOI|nr:hypothetical protein TorRG33x02_311140 [Trema orientale]